ncbi:MAG TPA: polysaccharide deacetylase family protein [Chloroflexota bacterium]|jgi:peptidoglycan/xylan/chitin deacetylase (PgdA/CDA1 family)
MPPGGQLIRHALPLLLAGVVALGMPLARQDQVAHAECAAEFGAGLANLRNAVGDAMGQAIDCETPINAAGDTIQHTSTGTSWFIGAQSDAIFTDGYHRWELDDRGLLYWSSPDATPLLEDGLSDGPALWTRAATCGVLYTHEVPSAVIFRQFVVGLIRAGLRPVSFAAVDASMSGQANLPSGCIVLSFDDSLASQLRNAVPVLTDLNISAMFFVMPGFHDGVHQYMDDVGIRALQSAGQVVGAHTCHHATLPLLAPSPMMAELADCKRQIENIIGVPVRYLAYPNGAVNQSVLSAVIQAGYRAAFTTRPSAVLRPEQPLVLPRIEYIAGESPAVVAGRVQAAGERLAPPS